MTLKVVDPIDITEAVLTASDILEPDASVGEVEWVDRELLTYLTGSSERFTATKANDGNIYCFGNDTGNILKIDVANQTTSLIPSTNARIQASVLANDGNIYAFGFNVGGVVKLNVGTQTSSLVAQGFVSEVNTASLGSDGNIYGLATAVEGVVKFNVASQSVSSFGTVTQTYDCSETGNDGNIYAIGRYKALRIDVAAQTVQEFGNYDIDCKAMTIGVDGNLYGVGRSGVVLKVDPTTLTTSTFGAYNGYYYAASLAKDGKIYCTGVGTSTKDLEVLVVDTVRSTTEKLGAYGSDYRASALGDDGVVYAVSRNTSQIIKIAPSYSVGDRVILESEHLVYQCLVSTRQNPKDGATEDATATWIEVGPTNKWAMFDGLQNTKTMSSTDFTITLNPVAFSNTLAIFGFTGVASIRIEVDNSLGMNIYDKTYSMNDFSSIYDHYTYAFYQISSLDKFIATDLPPLPNTTIRVTFSGSDMTIGELVTGFAIDIGQLVAENTKSDRFRYREQEYNEFGYPTGQPPIVVELNTYDVLVPKLNNQAIQRLLDTITGENTLWFGDIGGGQSLVTYGFFERSPIPYSMPNHINYQITVRASV
ncbi:hypothetical protein VPHK46_0054 [Vibrio phage K46]|nr:hypothetical protein SIPHO078v2_p0042 [Vibrio phage 14E30.1]QZI92486.1 hypothetical protein SIPHO058v2_p0038 [Vibrio phage 14E30.2]